MSCSKRTDNRSLFYAMAKDLHKDQNIASNFLDTINVSSFNKEEQMYGELLKIQATDLTDHDIKPYEKNISRIINYMQNKKDYTFLKLALYYAGRIKSEKDEAMKAVNFYTTSNPQPIGFSGILLAKRQNSFYCTYFLHNRNVADTKSPYPIKRLEVIRWFNQKSMVFNQSLS